MSNLRPEPHPDYYDAQYEADGPTPTWRKLHRVLGNPTELARKCLENEAARRHRQRRGIRQKRSSDVR